MLLSFCRWLSQDLEKGEGSSEHPRPAAKGRMDNSSALTPQLLRHTVQQRSVPGNTPLPWDALQLFPGDATGSESWKGSFCLPTQPLASSSSAQCLQPSSKVPSGASDALDGDTLRRLMSRQHRRLARSLLQNTSPSSPAELARKQFQSDFQNAKVIPILQF